MIAIRKNELRNYNGLNGQKAFIAYRGKVYDVSALFENGEHNHCIAGNDVTGILDMMPHGDKVIHNFPLMGVLSE